MIADNRMMYRFEMDPYLMCASRLRRSFDVRYFFSALWIGAAFQHMPFGDGGAEFPFLAELRRPPARIRFRPPYLHLNNARIFFRMAVHDRIVDLLDGPILELLFQERVRVLRLRDNHDTGRRPIESVHDA